jgi:hypothetical protein
MRLIVINNFTEQILYLKHLAETWLSENSEEIKIKHKVSKINVSCKYTIISNLGIVPDVMENVICSLIDVSKKEKLRYGRMWLKRMVNQAIRGSFECYINTGNEITNLDHVAEVNDDIVNLDSPINMNL